MKKIYPTQGQKPNSLQNMLSPYVIEERPMNITQLDVFSRLMMDRILFLSGEVCADTMDTLVAQMLFLDSLSHDPIHLYINSGGGECYSGLELVSVMQHIESPVYTTVLGLAASMGAVIASSGEKGHRKALRYSRFMVHQPSSGVGYSTFKDQEVHLKEMQRLKLDLYEVLAENSGQTVEAIEEMCDRDNWMKPDEAIALGFLDAVVTRAGE